MREGEGKVAPQDFWDFFAGSGWVTTQATTMQKPKNLEDYLPKTDGIITCLFLSYNFKKLNYFFLFPTNAGTPKIKKKPSL